MRVRHAIAFALGLMAAPASALAAGGTMQDWAGASPTDKDKLLREMGAMPGSSAAQDSLRSCLDGTAKAAGHANLPISEVAKACAEQSARDNI